MENKNPANSNFISFPCTIVKVPFNVEAFDNSKDVESDIVQFFGATTETGLDKLIKAIQAKNPEVEIELQSISFKIPKDKLIGEEDSNVK